MKVKRYKPSLDKTFLITIISTLTFLAASTVVSAFEPISLLITIPVDLFCAYFLISPLFGYVELRDDAVFIKYGFIMTKEIPYSSIRGTAKARKLYSDSTVSLKCSLNHVNIKYNKFDITSVSVADGDDLIEEINTRIYKD
jgi:hypothetical protein